MEIEIKKLDDIIEWADGIIRDAGYNEEKYKSDSASAYCHVKAYELWKIRDAVLKGMERHAVYTNALNQDISAKAAKIDLMQKEIDGRKAGYVALKARMDSKYISIEEHNKIVDQFKEEVKKLNKCIMNKNESINTGNEAIINLRKQIGDLKEEIESITKSRDIWFDTAGEHSNTIIEQSNTIKKLEEKVKRQKENLDGINKTLEIRTKENESLISVKNNQDREIEAHESENARLSEKIMKLREEQKTLVDICNKYKKENGDYAVRVNKLKKELDRVYGVAFAQAHEKEDDHGRAGFKRYIEHLIEEEERAVPERFKERLNEEITAIFEKEETEVKGVGRTSSGRYPWGAKVHDIPCGEDSIE